MAWPTAARADATPSFTIVHQDPVATVSSKGTSHFAVSLSTSPHGATSRARVTIYPRVIDRSQLAPIVADTGVTQKALGTTSTFTLKCETHGDFKFTVDLYSRRPGSSHRSCAPDAATALPLSRPAMRRRLPDPHPGDDRWRDVDPVVAPRRPVHRGSTSNCASTSSRPWTRTRGCTRNARSPCCTYSPTTPRRRSRCRPTTGRSTPSHAPGSQETLFHTALRKALVSPLHEAVNSPPANIDFAGLALHGFGDEVRHQLSLSATLLQGPDRSRRRHAGLAQRHAVARRACGH